MKAEASSLTNLSDGGRRKIAIVVPAYNEEKTIANVINRAKKFGDIIVGDDCSKDKTSETAKRAGAFVVRHEKNRGLGSGR